MAVPVSSLFDTQSRRMEERISKAVMLYLATADPVWRDTIVTAMGVASADALGRNMEVIKMMQTAAGGVIESGGPRGDFTTYGDATNTTYGAGGDLSIGNTSQTLPDANEDVSGVPIWFKIPMRSIMTNQKFTLGEMQAEVMPSTIGQITAPKQLAFARNLSRRLCSSWYTSQTESFRLCGLGPATGTGAYTVTSGTHRIRFYPSNKAVARLAKGDRVDLFKDLTNSGTVYPTRLNDTNVTAGGVVYGDAAGQTHSTRIKAVITSVNKMQGWAEISFDPSSTYDAKFTGTGSLTAGQLGDGAYVVWANSTVGGAAFTDIPGLNSYLKFGGSTNAQKRILGDEAVGTVGSGIIDVDVFPQHMSFYATVSGVLTEHGLNRYLDAVAEAMEDDGDFIDTLVTTYGVVRAAAAQKEAQMTLERFGKVNTLTASGEDGRGMEHAHNGRVYKIWCSRWQEYGTLHGYRRQGNWDVYVPPSLPGAQGASGVEAGIPFEYLVPSITGLPTTKWPIYTSTGRLTEASQMPGHLRMTLAPRTQFRGMKLASLTEDRVTSEVIS
jgi:hypothetical protein